MLFVAEERTENTWIGLTDQPIETARLADFVQCEKCGAAITFLGTTRRFTAGRETDRLVYECYTNMAMKKLAELVRQAHQTWPVEKLCVVHRLGTVDVGEASVAILVSAPHRKDAFAAAEWLIDTLKQVVPIWKQENWSDGTREWVHPVPTETLEDVEKNEAC